MVTMNKNDTSYKSFIKFTNEFQHHKTNNNHVQCHLIIELNSIGTKNLIYFIHNGIKHGWYFEKYTLNTITIKLYEAGISNFEVSSQLLQRYTWKNKTFYGKKAITYLNAFHKI